MQIDNEQKEEIKNILLSSGVYTFEYNRYEIYLNNKSTSRYITLIKSIRSYSAIEKEIENIPLTMDLLQDVYKIDVVARRILSEILKPIELRTRFHIALIAKKLQNIINDELFFDFQFDSSNKSSFVKSSRILKTRFFIKNSLLAISKKVETSDIKTIMEETSLGQVTAIISQMSNECLIKLLGNDNLLVSNANEIFENIKHLRNHIAHHSILFNFKGINTGKRLESNPKFLEYSEILGSIDKLSAYTNYSTDFKNKLLNYKNNLINKQEEKKEHYEFIFAMIF